jgi:hypothetical protein
MGERRFGAGPGNAQRGQRVFACPHLSLLLKQNQPNTQYLILAGGLWFKEVQLTHCGWVRAEAGNAFG